MIAVGTKVRVVRTVETKACGVDEYIGVVVRPDPWDEVYGRVRGITVRFDGSYDEASALPFELEFEPDELEVIA